MTMKINSFKSFIKEGSKDVDKIAADELKLFIDNDSGINRQIESIIKNMVVKMAQGKYDEKQAPKAFMYAVDSGSKQYKKEFGDDFDKPTRMYVAQEMAKEYQDEIENGNYNNYVPKKFIDTWKYK